MADPKTVQLPSDENVAADTSLRNILLSCLLVVLLVAVGSVASQSLNLTQPVQQQVSEDAPPDLTNRPFGVTRQLLTHLQEENYGEAHKILSIQRARLVKPGEFGNLSRELRSYEEEQSPFHVLTEVVAGRQATVVVGQTLQGSPDNLWTLQYELEAGDWKLVSATGQSFSQRLWGKVNES